MKKVVIVGCGGAGKSTLARQLGHVLGLPVIHLDAKFWQPGWRMISKANEQAILQNIISQDAWIIDGNYQSTIPIRFAAADTIIFLDFSPLLCLWRILKRYRQYRGTTRPDMSEGCPEKLDWSFLGWILSYRHVSRPVVLKRLMDYADNRSVLIFKNPGQVDAFIEQLANRLPLRC